jgi:hypothetical protein
MSDDMHPEVKKWIQDRRSRGAKSTNKKLQGTDTAKTRAAAAAKARWDAYYEKHPEKLAAKLAKQRKK